jgi:glycine cleavage system H lipoate-binding protein
MAGTIVAVTPKRAGRRLAAGNACAVFESGRFVGPAKIAFPAEIVRSNDAIMERPALAHSDPYGAAWLLVLRPDDWNSAKALLGPRRRRAVSRADEAGKLRGVRRLRSSPAGSLDMPGSLDMNARFFGDPPPSRDFLMD